MIDRYLNGRVERISPEAPVPVLSMTSRNNRLGGAANVALNIAALGAEPILASLVGQDENAALFRDLLTDYSLSDQLIVEDGSRPTTVKTRLTSGGQQLLRVDHERTHNSDPRVADRLLSKIKGQLATGQIDAVLCQDYNKGVLHADFTAALLRICHQRGIQVVVDPKNEGFWTYRNVELFKPNLREIQRQVDFPIEPRLPDLDRAAAVIHEKIGPRNIMITLSQHGIYVYQDGTSAIYPTEARDVADVSGAGDTVISVAAVAMATGMPIWDIAKLSNLAGAQVIAKRGVVAVDAEALRRAAVTL